MSNPRALARQAATEVGIDPKLFTSLVHAESGFNPRARSPVGAMGFTQLMPGTAHGLSKKYGIDTNTPYGNLLGGAYYLKEQIDRFGDLRKAVAAYNAGPGAVEKYGGVPPYAETKAYVQKVLAGGGVAKHTSRFPAPTKPIGTDPTAPLQTGALHDALLQNLLQIGAQGGHVDAVSMLQGIAGGIAADRAVSAGPAVTRDSTSSSSSTPTGGKVSIRSGADRPGVSLSSQVISFVKQISALTGKPLEIGTGTNHNQYVLGTRRQSAHWTGHAADIPASGADLLRLGRAALVAAGMAPARAQKAQGGVYNVGGYQVLFRTYVGGNHWNHLHVGLRG